ncbi:MAG: hypothetical protein HY554_18650 [Elusimicrobia bacterium]|nr:hypothetical protein [Elusimicrobiota bacterium]
MSRSLAASLAMAAALGCAGLRPSPYAEVTIPGLRGKAVAQALREKMIARGYEVTRSSGTRELAFAKAADTFGASAMLGAGKVPPRQTRVRYRLQELEQGVRVGALVEVVSNPGKAFQYAADDSDGPEAADVRAILAGLLNAARKKVSVPDPAAPPPRAAPRKEEPRPPRPEPDAAPRPSLEAPPPPRRSEDSGTLDEMERRALGVTPR